MQKRYFWAKQVINNGPGESSSIFLHRFRTMADCQSWMDKTSWAEVIGGEDPDVCRILRRLRKGEQIGFPVEIGP